jgi:acetate kinase
VIVLVLNCGGSFLKFQVIDAGPEAMAGGQARRLVRGSIERIGADARLRFEAVRRAAASEDGLYASYPHRAPRDSRDLPETRFGCGDPARIS